MVKEGTKTITLRVDPTLATALKKLAKDENRSINNMAVYILSKALAAEKPAS